MSLNIVKMMSGNKVMPMITKLFSKTIIKLVPHCYNYVAFLFDFLTGTQMRVNQTTSNSHLFCQKQKLKLRVDIVTSNSKQQ